MIQKEEYIRHIIEKYMQGDASTSEIELIKLWMKSNNQIDHWLSEQIDATPAAMDQVVSDRVYHNIVHSFSDESMVENRNSQSNNQHPKEKSEKIHSYYFIYGIAASIILFIIGFIALDLHIIPTSEQYSFSITTNIGEHPTVTLADGSIVKINSLSSLTYTFDENQNKRIVSLQGEAYFIVKPNRKCPFIVHTQNLSVECLGTEFDVKAYPLDKSESVILTEGKVCINSGSSEEIIKPNTMLVYNKETTAVTKKKVFCDNYINWDKNLLYFDNAHLIDIVNAIYRSTGVRITFDELQFGDAKFIGAIGGRDYKTAIEILSQAIEAKYTIQNDTIIHLYKAR